MAKITIERDDGSYRTFQMDDNAVTMAFHDGSSIRLGDDVTLNVVEGKVILSGDVATTDPEVAGAVYLHPTTKALTVSQDPSSEPEDNPFPTGTLPTADPLEDGRVWQDRVTGTIRISIGIVI